MTMGCNGDGFTNPYCNNCNGCGGGQCQGPSCGCGPCQGGKCGCGSCCDECDPCNTCPHYAGHAPYGRPWILAPLDWMAGQLDGGHCGWWWAEDLTLFAGVHDFKNITNGGQLSNFGFQEGVNWGVPIVPDLGLAAQVGYEATQSQFEDPTGSRSQSFFTAGIFHHPPCDYGWDAGLAFDWLHDDIGASFDIAQARGELGWQFDCRNEIGFWFAKNVIDDGRDLSLDQYNFFYRRQFCRCADVRIWGGFSGGESGIVSGGLFGADFEVPLSKRLALDGGFNYFIPDSKSATTKFLDGSWNLGFNLVWYIGGTAECCCTPYRPMFDPADNGSLITVMRPVRHDGG